MKLPSQRAAAPGDNLLSCLCSGPGSGAQASRGNPALHSTTPTPGRLALPGFSSSGLWNLLWILSPQDEVSRCRSAYQVPRHLPDPRASSSLLLHSPATAALLCSDRWQSRVPYPHPKPHPPGSEPASGRGGWVPVGRTWPPGRGVTRAGLQVPACVRAGLVLRGIQLQAGPAGKAQGTSAGPLSAFSKCFPSTVELRRPWGHILRNMGEWCPHSSEQQPGQHPQRKSCPLGAVGLAAVRIICIYKPLWSLRRPHQSYQNCPGVAQGGI